MRALLKPFIALAAAGLVASVVVHVCALLKKPNPFGPYSWGLHVGIFVVWLPAVIAANRQMAQQNIKQKDFWKVALAGCPPWMRSLTLGLFVYAIANFALLLAATIHLDPKHVDPNAELRGFSGHWMVFYAAAMALMYSALHGVHARCAAGHEASPAARFCEQCGAPVTVTQDQPS